MSRLEVCAATPRDLPAIMAMEADGFDGTWSADSWAEEIDGHDRHVVVVRGEDGEALGVATFQTVADTSDLHRVVVARDARGRGFGSRLVRDGLAWARREGAERMLLEVEHDNAPALALYRGLDFTEISRRSNYYGPGRHAVVMERNLA